MRVISIIIGLMGAVTVMAIPHGGTIPVCDMTAPADTTYLGEDNDEDETTEADRTRQMKAEGFNAMDYVLERRYLPTGETFTRSLKDHLYIIAGLGGEGISAPDENWKMGTLLTYYLGAGKQFSELHSARVYFHGGTSYLHHKDLRFNKYSLRAEHLYGLSSYFSGYNPTRLLNVSSILGLGAQYSKLKDKSGMSFEGHLGLQFCFYTGPQAYINIEPYLGVSTDNSDLSENRNWRKADLFYGVNVNVIYYLKKNFSPESRMRAIQNRRPQDEMSGDSLLMSWQQPWFVQFSNGLTMMNSPSVGMQTGSDVTLAGGKWLSPVIGLRASLSSRNVTWHQQVTPADETSYHPEYVTNLKNTYLSARLEVLLNPLGFLKNFLWDSRFGLFLSAGYEIGNLHKMQSEELRCSVDAVSLGLNLWYRLTNGLKVFLEPHFTHYNYHIPYSNVSWEKRYSDNQITLSAGLSVEMRDHERWGSHSYEYEYFNDRMHKVVVGVGSGTHFTQTTFENAKGSNFGFNGILFGEYNFNRLFAARLGLEYVSLRRSNITDYIDYNMDNPEEGNSPVPQRGLWNHKYNLLAISPGFMSNLGQLFAGYQSSPFRMYAFGGPSVFLLLNRKSSIDQEERVMENHKVDLNIPSKMAVSFGGHFGVKLIYQWKPRIAFHLTPTIYFLGSTDLPGMNFTKLKFVETINLGVQYGF